MKYLKVVPFMFICFALLFSGQETFAATAKSTAGITFEGTTTSAAHPEEPSTSKTGESGDSTAHQGELPKTGERNQHLSSLGVVVILVALLAIYKRKGNTKK